MAYDLGIVIPVYRSRESVKKLVLELEKTFLPDIKIRICLVDDSNDEDTARYLMENCLRPEVTLAVLDGNFGQQAAILCGLRHVGSCRTYGTIDDDLEQPPRMLRKLYGQVADGKCDLAYGIPAYKISDHKMLHHGRDHDVFKGRKRNGRPVYRRVGSGMRDLLFSRLIGAPRGMKVSSLRVMTAQVVKDALAMKPRGFFYLSAAALKSAEIKGRKLQVENLYYTPGRRQYGFSGYNLGKLLRLYGNIAWYYGLDRGGKGLGQDEKECGQGGNGRRQTVYRIRDLIRPEKLLMLGGSNCQLHGAQRARSMGVDTVLADYTKNPLAASVCGVHEKISTFDVQACIRAAKRYGVTGVMTMGTDQPVYTCACISRELGLPGLLTVEQAYSVTNKKQMKQILSQAGIPTARYRLVDRSTGEKELKGLKTPLVIKPLDSQGQRGIYKLDTPLEVMEHLEHTLSFSRCSQALAEEFYESDEVTVSGWIKDGRLHILTVTDRLLYPDQTHIGVCTGHRFPSVHMDLYEEIEDISKRVADAFELENGPFYLQILIGAEGIKVNELAARIGGAFEDVFIPWVSGFDILGAVMDSAMGRRDQVQVPDGYRADRREGCVAVQLLFCRPGTIGHITPVKDILALPYVLDAGYNYKIGQEIPVMENATARFGHCVICGTKENIRERVDDFYRRLSVKSQSGEEMICRFYP